jgi:hypothetical protein
MWSRKTTGSTGSSGRLGKGEPVVTPFLIRHRGAWLLSEEYDGSADATVTMLQDDAWLAFTKKMDRHKKQQLFPAIRIEGDIELGSTALEMVSIMA